jgi:hypothetical protein
MDNYSMVGRVVKIKWGSTYYVKIESMDDRMISGAFRFEMKDSKGLSSKTPIGGFPFSKISSIDFRDYSRKFNSP